jgi:hypothetical protein
MGHRHWRSIVPAARRGEAVAAAQIVSPTVVAIQRRFRPARSVAMTEWSIQGQGYTNCNCAYGCPCQFNALPTHGDCRAALGLRIAKGHLGAVGLDGLRIAALYSWPSAVHQGDGTVRADQESGDRRRASRPYQPSARLRVSRRRGCQRSQQSSGASALGLEDTHAHFCNFYLTHQGVLA